MRIPASNNFTIISSYLHAVLANKISCVKNKNDAVSQAWVSIVKKCETREGSRLLFLSFVGFSVFFREWLLNHVFFCCFCFFPLNDGYHSTVIHGIYQYLHTLELLIQVGFQLICESCTAKILPR